MHQGTKEHSLHWSRWRFVPSHLQRLLFWERFSMARDQMSLIDVAQLLPNLLLNTDFNLFTSPLVAEKGKKECVHRCALLFKA